VKYFRVKLQNVDDDWDGIEDPTFSILTTSDYLDAKTRFEYLRCFLPPGLKIGLYDDRNNPIRIKYTIPDPEASSEICHPERTYSSDAKKEEHRIVPSGCAERTPGSV
jgi:hypothetical protein